MHPEIVVRDEFIVVGIRSVFEMGVHAADALWKEKFLPRRNEIPKAAPPYYGVFNILPNAYKSGCYEYVAGVVATLEDIPSGMVGWVVPSGKYAEMPATGLADTARVIRDIITVWLPDSGYTLVPTPLFAYTSDPSPDSPRAVWKVNVPVETPDVLAQLEKWKV